MIQFKQVTSEEQKEFTAVRDITMTCCDDASLTEMYEAFDSFLRACGYAVDASKEELLVADFGNDPYGNDPYYHEATENAVVNEYLK